MIITMMKCLEIIDITDVIFELEKNLLVIRGLDYG
jgi:hypothetical protein